MSASKINMLLCMLIAGAVIGFIIWYTRKIMVFRKTETIERQSYEYRKIKDRLQIIYNNIIYSPPEDLSISYEEAAKRRETKDALSQAKRNASVNDYSARLYLLAFINKTLQTELGIDEVTINLVFPFDNKKKLDPHVRFLVLMYTVMQDVGSNTWTWLQEENHLSDQRENGRFEIYQTDIDMMLDKYVTDIPYTVKLDVLSQRLYEDLFGQGRIDIMTWQNIEDIAVGQGGLPISSTSSEEHRRRSDSVIAAHDKVVILYKGKNLHLNFLGMGSARELERVCRHICLYKNPGELSEDVGYLENSLANGDRCVVYRDSFGDSWGLLIRKHNEGKLLPLTDMYPVDKQGNAQYVHILLHIIAVGCQSAAVTGQMYTGKTSVVRALVNEANPNYNYRVLESVFELGLRNLFPTRDVATFLEREDLPGDKVLEFLKRTNGTVLILGEMLKEVSANWLISAGQSGFKYVLTTTHSKTTESLIKWLLNAKLNTSGSTNADLAILDIINAIHFDVHCGMDEISGNRYIERVTEIVPTDDESLYKIVDILVYDKWKNEYVIKNQLSERTLNEIRQYATDAEYDEVVTLFGSHSMNVRAS